MLRHDVSSPVFVTDATNAKAVFFFFYYLSRCHQPELNQLLPFVWQRLTTDFRYLMRTADAPTFELVLS